MESFSKSTIKAISFRSGWLIFSGRHNVYTVLAAIGAGLAGGINLVKSVEAVSNMKPPLGRMNLLEGINGSLLFDDSYNSSPIAAEAAIEVLSEYPAKKKNRRLGRYEGVGRIFPKRARTNRRNIESQKCLVFVYCRTRGEIYRRRSEKKRI